MLDAHDLDAAADDDALAFELVEHDRGAFRIVLGERLRRFQHGHRAAEPAEGLRHFQADRPGADDDEMLRPLGEIENRLVGEIRTLRRARGSAAAPASIRSRSRNGARGFRIVADDDRPAVLEFRVALDHAHAKPGEALRRIGRRDRGDHALHVIVHLGEIDRRRLARSRRTAPALRMSVGALGRRQQGLRRHAAGVEAIAAHLVPFDQHHRHAEGRRGRGHRQAAGAAADHANVGCECFRHALKFS